MVIMEHYPRRQKMATRPKIKARYSDTVMMTLDIIFMDVHRRNTKHFWQRLIVRTMSPHSFERS